MRTALAFSGGKDSWACLFLNVHRLTEIVVIWVNTGKSFPEALAMIEKARAMCPNFVEVCVDRDAQNERCGIPSDLVPVDHTDLGMQVTSPKSVKIQSYLQCCYENISKPLMDKCKELGVTELIRGQRLSESHKSPARDGDVVEGITFRQPIERWSSEDVSSFISRRMDIPDHFALSHTSLDCYDCTAYGRETADRVAWARKYPELSAAYEDRRVRLVAAIVPHVEALRANIVEPTHEVSL